LTTAGADERNEIKEIIRNFSDKGPARIMVLLKEHHSIELSLEKARSVVDEAIAELAVFPESQAKDALLAISEYSLHREK
jgi:geranylgeranyl pyrophosphate synthase